MEDKLKFSSMEIIQHFESQEIKVLKGYSGEPNIIFESDNGDGFKQFLQLATELNVSHVFIDVSVLEEDDIEMALISDDDLIEAGILIDYLPKVKDDVDEYNEKLNALRKNVGEELMIDLVFAHQGILYSYNMNENSDRLDLMGEMESFIETLKKEHEASIREHEDKHRTLINENKEKVLEQLEADILNDDGFRKCTNSNLRKSYAINIYKKEIEYFSKNRIAPSEITNTVEIAWRKFKEKN
ncbi:hypothetical protein [Paenibacillus alkalitolerans]|uniref:hypothetical protein n=1 Tax=Paenibacillus alkalitolerans TaxID=2799335 RepID=UPI0018F580E3|nr:hypothetical protein [Paenibacillus alkalitolerans]